MISLSINTLISYILFDLICKFKILITLQKLNKLIMIELFVIYLKYQNKKIISYDITIKIITFEKKNKLNVTKLTSIL